MCIVSRPIEIKFRLIAEKISTDCWGEAGGVNGGGKFSSILSREACTLGEIGKGKFLGFFL